MKNTIQKKKQEGFTIIEVLIVLAIAGLIILIVFLAVPALQRNSRNTQRANDVSRALGAAQEVLNNNNGSLTALDTAALRTAIGAPAFYTADPNITVGASVPSPAANSATTDTMILYKGASCGANGVVQAGTTRQLAVAFRAEVDVPRCQSS